MHMTEDFLRSRVMELFHVELDSGKFIRKTCVGSRKTGSVAGAIRPDGYRTIRVDNKGYLEHRLIILVSSGFIPEQVDHINGIRSDNRLANLRPATPHINSRNQKMSSANKSGATGVRYRSLRDAYEAYWDTECGKKKYKYFSCAKYGDSAFSEALQYRKSMIELMNGEGAGYTPRHGSAQS